MIDFCQMDELDQIERRIADHEAAGRDVEWMGSGSRSLGLSDGPVLHALSMALAPVLEMQTQDQLSSGTFAAISLLFSPPFDPGSQRGERKAALRSAHIKSARVAALHIDGWTAVRDTEGAALRPSGLIYLLSVAENSFIVEMLILGWGLSPDARWGLVDGWSIASQLAAAEGVYASELEQRLAYDAMRLIWLGPRSARLKPMLWPDRGTRDAISPASRLPSTPGTSV